MRGSIYLIGGGELRDGETRPIDEDVLSLAPEGSTFVFFGFAAQDSTAYANAITSVYGSKCKVVIPTEKKGRDFAINAIRSAAVIYLGGGDTDQLMRVFSEWDLVEYLNTALMKGVHVAGMSAGAQALSTWYIHEDSDVFELRKGWGVVPVGVLVHANPNSLDKASSLWSSRQMTGTCPFFAIGEGAAWRIDSSEQHKVGLGTIWKIDDKVSGEVEVHRY
jgi:hypothetical protein